MIGANKPSRVSVPWIFVLLICNNWNKRLLNWIELDWFKSLTQWGRVTHICVSKLTIIGSDNGSSPGPRQAIIWTNAGILSIRLLGTNFNEILIEILTFSFMKMLLKVSSAKWRPFCLGLNLLSDVNYGIPFSVISVVNFAWKLKLFVLS